MLGESLWAVWASIAAGALIVVTVGYWARARRRVGKVSSGSLVEPPEQVPVVSPDQRRALRRSGNPLPVLISDADGVAPATEGTVVDRSADGMRLEVNTAANVGTVLSVRPARATPSIPWVQVEVRSCRPSSRGYELGCRFVRPAPSNVLWLFG